MSIMLRPRLFRRNEWPDLLFILSETFTKNLFHSGFEHWSDGKVGAGVGGGAVIRNIVMFEPDALQGRSMATTNDSPE